MTMQTANRLSQYNIVFSKKKKNKNKKQEGYDGPVSLDWLICKIPSYQTLQYLGNISPQRKTTIGSHEFY